MSLSDHRVLPVLYDGLATPPLSPLNPRRKSSHPVSVSPVSSASPTPLNLSSDKPHEYSITPPVPRSLHPTQFAPPLQPALRIITNADSLTRERKGKMPMLSHLLSVGNSGRVLALAGDDRHVYAGCQSAENEIVVFSRTSLQPMYRLLGHQGSILALMVIKEKGWLVSSSSAGDVRIWCTTNLAPKFIIHPCDDTAGDIYTLAWDERAGGTLYFGTQGATIEWVNFGPAHQSRPSAGASASVTVPFLPNGPTPAPQRTGRYRPHHFFDNPPSNASSGTSTPRVASCRSPGTYFDHPTTVQELEVSAENRLSFAHYGYVYTMQMISQADGSKLLASGSGDSDVKVFMCAEGGGLEEVRHFTGLPGAVLSFAYRDSLLYAGTQEGEIEVWDLETGALIRNIHAHEADVLTMSVLGDEVYTAAADGRVLRVNQEFDCTAAFRAHSGIILSSIVVEGLKTGWELITAGNDSFVKIWSINEGRPNAAEDLSIESEGDVMLYALAKLIAVPTVSDEAHRESCRQGAHLLKKILAQLGARAEMLSGEQGRNPLVLATFTGTKPDKARKRLLFYGHYDVQPAAESDWETNPWELSGRNGYLYGRGVSDNKGPILAVACAAAALQKRRELDVDLVLLIEGEEEAGSRGFAATVRNHKADIGHIDAVLLSNSTWIGENDPCIVFGMRGVVYANLSIWGAGEDAHSGVDGGVVAEPMFDMIRVLAGISDKHTVKLPGFYDAVRKSTPEEMRLLQDVAKVSDKSLDELVKVWRQPSFSIANISSSGTSNKTIIPRKVTADISMRIVPDQDLGTIVESLKSHGHAVFDALESDNQFDITVTHSASWWLTSLESPYFQALESSVEEVWGHKPLKIREGGTVPTIFWLEQEFQAPCVHLPLGQSSDAGHLANERMRLLNLRNGKRVVESFLGKLGSIS